MIVEDKLKTWNTIVTKPTNGEAKKTNANCSFALLQPDLCERMGKGIHTYTEHSRNGTKPNTFGETTRERQTASENETLAINLSQHPISFQLRIYCEKIKTIYSCWKSFRCKFFPVLNLPRSQMAFISVDVTAAAAAAAMYVCVFCVFLCDCGSCADSGCYGGRGHRRRCCSLQRCLFMSRDLFWTVNFSTGFPHSFEWVRFFISFLALVGRWSCCVCFAVLLIIFICCPFIQSWSCSLQCSAISTFHTGVIAFFCLFLSFHPLCTKFPFCSLTFPVFISFHSILLLTN